MKFSLTCLLALACPVLSISGAYAVEEERLSAVIVMQDADVASLKQTGYMKMAIPPAMVNRVDSVTLKRPVRFKDKAAVLFNDVDRRSGMVTVSVDDATMEQIDYQPVELKIFESGFSSIVVEYRPGNSAPTQKASKNDSAVFVTSLTNSKSLTGRLADMKEFAIKSELGKVDVDLDDVSQITFEEDDQATVQMLNGDQLSGEIDFQNITIKSRWGLEDLKVSEVVSISKPLTKSIASGVPVSLPQSIPVPQVLHGQPGIATPSYSYPNVPRIDSVPQPLNQPIGNAYDAYAGQKVFDQAVDQLMQPVPMMPMGQPIGPFFGEPMPIGEPMPMGEQPVGGYGEMMQNLQEVPMGDVGAPTTAPTGQSDFWFFPAN